MRTLEKREVLPLGTLEIETKNPYWFNFYHIPVKNDEDHTTYVNLWRKAKEKEGIDYPLKQIRYLFGPIFYPRRKYPQRVNLERQKKYIWRIKWELFRELGNKCKFCDETNLDVLQVHHIGEKNGYHWRQYRQEYYDDYKSLVLLCANCHISIHKGLIPLVKSEK